jgi:hypothetical protein
MSSPNYRRFEPKMIPSSNGVNLPPLNFSKIQQTQTNNPNYSSLPFSPSKTRSVDYKINDASSSPPNSPPPLRRGVASPVHCLRPIPIRGFREFVTSSDSSSSASDSSSSSSSSSTTTPSPKAAAAAADDAKPKKYWDIMAAIATASTYGYEP